MAKACLGPREASPEAEVAEEDLGVLIDFVGASVGVRLRDYRPSTIVRRAANRLKLAGCRDCAEYLDLLAREPEEAKRLVEYVTIKWSCFFREATVFARLREQVLPDLAERYGEELAIWSAGCGRGEEPYSLSIALREMAAAGQPVRATIYGTDIDETALRAAGERVYAQSALNETPKRLVDAYFTEQPGRCGPAFRLHDEVAASVRFRRHDLLSGEGHPERRAFHLVLCRNVLIYFQRQAQERVLDLLSASLLPGGYLCLGTAEQLPASHSQLFETVDHRDRIYRKL